MLAFLAAATVALATAEAPNRKAVVTVGDQPVQIHNWRAGRGTPRCRDGVLHDASLTASPALLRERDRKDARAKKLTELPMAEACLLAEPRRAAR